jgi:hypothetical protein
MTIAVVTMAIGIAATDPVSARKQRRLWRGVVSARVPTDPVTIRVEGVHLGGRRGE